MKYRLGKQRPLGIVDVRERKRPSIVGVALVAPALLLAFGLVAHFALQAARGGSRVVIPVALGFGSLLVVWAIVSFLPKPSADKP